MRKNDKCTIEEMKEIFSEKENVYEFLAKKIKEITGKDTDFSNGYGYDNVKKMAEVLKDYGGIGKDMSLAFDNSIKKFEKLIEELVEKNKHKRANYDEKSDLDILRRKREEKYNLLNLIATVILEPKLDFQLNRDENEERKLDSIRRFYGKGNTFNDKVNYDEIIVRELDKRKEQSKGYQENSNSNIENRTPEQSFKEYVETDYSNQRSQEHDQDDMFEKVLKSIRETDKLEIPENPWEVNSDQKEFPKELYSNQSKSLYVKEYRKSKF